MRTKVRDAVLFLTCLCSRDCFKLLRKNTSMMGRWKSDFLQSQKGLATVLSCGVSYTHPFVTLFYSLNNGVRWVFPLHSRRNWVTKRFQVTWTRLQPGRMTPDILSLCNTGQSMSFLIQCLGEQGGGIGIATLLLLRGSMSHSISSAKQFTSYSSLGANGEEFQKSHFRKMFSLNNLLEMI